MTLSDYAPQLAEGLKITLEVTVLAALLGLILSVVVGAARRSSIAAVRAVARVYVEFFRGTSALVQLFWIFFALPAFGISLTPLQAGVIGLALNASAYGAEVVRAAVGAVPRTQTEAALALHMSAWHRYRYVLAPQAAAVALPPFGNLLIELLKNTSLVSLVTLSDLTFKAQTLRAATGHTELLFTTLLVTYFVVATILLTLMRLLERHLARHMNARSERLSIAQRLGGRAETA